MKAEMNSATKTPSGRSRTADIVLYLDLDGVVQHESVCWDRRRGIFMSSAAGPDRTLFEWVPLLEEVLAPYPQVALVLSSSWCVWPGFSKTLKRLPPGLRSRFIGGTYHRREHGVDPQIKASFEEMSRGQQVCADVLRRNPEQWLALDDDVEGWPEWARYNLIACDGSTGLSCDLVRAELREKLQWCVLEVEKEARRRSDLTHG